MIVEKKIKLKIEQDQRNDYKLTYLKQLMASSKLVESVSFHRCFNTVAIGHYLSIYEFDWY